jgi:PPIC-type PPIASE domain
MRPLRRLIPLGGLVALASCAGLAACGGSGSRSTHVAIRAGGVAEQLREPADRPAVVARVGPYTITEAALARAMRAKLDSAPAAERLVAPDFTACVGHLKEESTARGEAALGPAQLRRECRARYERTLQTVLDGLISDDWLIGAARELGAQIGAARDLGAQIGAARRLGAPVDGRSLEKSPGLAYEAIRRAVRASVRPATRAQVADYYARHRFQYLLAGERDVRIARTETQAEAARARAELASGRSFASVVRTLRARQADFSREGLVMGLRPHVYGEPNLDQAIFTARRGVLTGPMRTWFGWFVFEVTRVRVQRERPLRDVEASIRRRLTAPAQEQALAAFFKRWRATWRARTDCSPGYVVPDCRQSATS